MGDNDLQDDSAQLAKEYAFAARLNSQARQASADRAWLSIARFYKNCREKKPGKKGYPRFQHDNRSVEYKTTGWRLEPDGKRITFTDGQGIGALRMLGTNPERKKTRSIATFSPFADQARAPCQAGGWLLCAICRQGRADSGPSPSRQTGGH